LIAKEVAMPVDPTVVFKSGREQAEAVARQVLASVPADGDARAEWFISWRNRTLEALAGVFNDGAGPVDRFREIEFGPRRLTGDGDRDDNLRRDAFKAGCAASRQLFQRVIDRIQSMASDAAPLTEAVRIAQVFSPPDPLPDAGQSLPDAAQPPSDAAQPERLSFPANPYPESEAPSETADLVEVMEIVMPQVTATPSTSDRTARLTAAVSKGFVRWLSSAEQPKNDAATIAAAKLLTDLTLLCEDPAFRDAFANLAAAAGEDDPSCPRTPDPTALWCAALALSRLRPAA
jgi:hypothetical protein